MAKHATNKTCSPCLCRPNKVANGFPSMSWAQSKYFSTPQ
jgi:hypothetical protein